MFRLPSSNLVASSRSLRFFNRKILRHFSASSKAPTIIYTYTDEAPALATHSLLPILRKFLEPSGIKLELFDISLSNRILAEFYPEKERNYLEELREIVQKPDANIIKLPNISASVPQLVEALEELRKQGYDDLPDYTPDPTTEREKHDAKKFDRILGSVVNPVLREGNSDRRVATPVKEYAQANPHKMMKPFDPNCQAQVVHMSEGDFYANEKSKLVPQADTLEIVFTDESGAETVRKSFAVKAGTVVDGTFMSSRKLREYFDFHIKNTPDNLLLSLHLKCTMMKVSDPIMFGMCVEEFYKPVFEIYRNVFKEIGVNPNNGVSDIYDKIHGGDLSQQWVQAIETAVSELYKSRPKLAMVNSAKGITNLHVPSDVIIDASMPNVIRDGGKMWGADDKLHEVICMIPDRCYATIYKTILEDCKKKGQFDPSTMGTVNNVGLMAQKAEEYGSHDKTFKAKTKGTFMVRSAKTKDPLFKHAVEAGDTWRSCTTTGAAIADWVVLALSRSQLSKFPVIFWLDSNRAHDREISKLLLKQLAAQNLLPKEKIASLASQANLSDLPLEFGPARDSKFDVDVQILPPDMAMQKCCDLVREGKDAIGATGNVLRDYLTDLFPILELGTSAKMLSIVPFLNGGAMYETGAGGSAPKHVEQLLKENHLRWDSLGEFLAVAVSLEDIGNKIDKKYAVLGETLNEAVSRVLNEHKSPQRKAKQIDNRGSHFYLALYWAEALATSDKLDGTLKKEFQAVYEALKEHENHISQELINCQGKPADIGGYYKPIPNKADRIMRPSQTFNDIISSL